MTVTPAPFSVLLPRRAAIIDLGSNSVRMVVYEGVVRNPVPIFNEKATLRLGAGLEKTGKLSEEGIARALDVLSRFQTIARAMGAQPFDVLATAAVRDAKNGAEFVEAAKAHMPDARFRVLNGEEEADYSAAGVLCALPEADGLVADIGGGSLELIRIAQGAYFEADTMPLGVIRLHERAEGDVKAAARIAEQRLAQVAWLEAAKNKPLYLVGGAFRALARLYISKTDYPLNMVHLFRLGVDEAREMAEWVAQAPRKELEQIGNVPRKRIADAPFAAVVLLELLARLSPPEIVFSSEGLREGWYMRDVAAEVAAAAPMDALAGEMADRLGRNASLPDALIAWTTPIFLSAQKWEDDEFLVQQHKLACMVSDIGSYDHPQYRAEQTYRRLLLCHGVGFDHLARVFLALVLAVRYDIDRDSSVLEPSRRLLSPHYFAAAVQLGLALRLAYTLCAGTEALLDGTCLDLKENVLTLDLVSGGLRAGGRAVSRRLERLAEALGVESLIREGETEGHPS